jgi:diguanylate cyclase (GGDEF)-like protein/PAS domain S-box-containing protein
MDAVTHKAGAIRLPYFAAGFVALVCAAIVTITAVREWSAREADLAAEEVSMRNLARSLTQHIEDSFDLAEASIIGAASRLDAEGTTSEVVSKLQKVLVARKEGSRIIYGFAIADANGNWLATSGATGSNLSERAFFIHHKQSTSHDTFVGPAFRTTTGEWLLTLSRRFNHPDGSFAGVVVVSIGAKYFSDFYGQFDIGETGTVSLVSADGVIQARRPDNGSIGRDVSNGAFFRGIGYRGSSGVYYFLSSLDGMRRLGVYQRSERYRFIILVTKAQDEVLAGWRSAAVARTGFVLGLVVLIAIIGFYLVRQLVKGERMAAALASKEASFRALAEGSSDLVTRVSLDGTVQYVSPSSIRILGWRPEQLVGTQALDGINPEDLPRVEETVRALRQGELEDARMTYRARHRKKSEVWVESALRVTRAPDGEIDGVVAILRDVTQQKDLEGRLETLATEDGLTGLANRRHFDERLLQEFGRAYREHTSLGILMIDLDHFKQYNDEYGHLAGDECLRAFARILSAEALRTTDLAARYGGEEFVMLLPNTDAAGCARIGERIRRALREAAIPHVLNKPSGQVTASIGGAICRPGLERTAGPASLVDAADRALYSAKDGGRDRLVMAAEVVTVLPVASALRRGIRELHEAR